VSFQYPDRISVEETVEVEVQPKHAVLSIVVEGESTGLGNEAFRKSKEVGRLIDELVSIGYSMENISLESVFIESSSGKLLRTTSAKFSLLLTKVELAQIPKILGIIAAQKNIEVEGMDYEFGELADERQKLLMEGCVLSKRQGQRICEAFGVKLLGLYSLSQKWTLPFSEGISQRHLTRGLKLSKSASAPSSELEGLEFSANVKSLRNLTPFARVFAPD
jgi:hypothetical protein